MLRREDHERGPEQRVRPRREHAQRLAARMMVGRSGLEVDLRALRAADPVRLLDADGLRPVDAAEVEQLVRVGRRAQVPLLEVALLDRSAAAPAMPIRALDLFACQRPVVGAPVDRRHLPVGEALLQEPQEHPLVPAVVRRVGGDHLVLPGEGRAHRAELAAHVLHVLHRPGERMAALPDRRVLGRQPEGIEADREEDVEAVHPPIARQRIARRHDVPVPDVQVARRIRVHRQHVVLGPARVREVGVVQAELRPARLPARLDRRRVVALDPWFGRRRTRRCRRSWRCRRCRSRSEPLVGRRRRFTPRRRRGVRVGGSTFLVELRGLEPRTPCMPCRCSSS